MEPHVSYSTGLINPEVLPLNVVPNFKVAPYFKEDAETLLEEIVKFQQKKNPEKWTYFTAEELAKSKNISPLPKEVLATLHSLVDSGYLNRTGVYYHVSDDLVEILKLYTKKILN
jgi:hypothetical protein